MRSQGVIEATEELYSLASGPDKRVNVWAGCMVNGLKFVGKEREERRTTQDSGLCVVGEHKGKEILYYGTLTKVIELDYVKDCRVFLFECKWYDLERHKPDQIDEEFVSIHIGQHWYGSDSYILADQGNKVFYVNDTKLKGDWRVVQKAYHRHLFDEKLLNPLLRKDEQDHHDPYQEEDSLNVELEDDNAELGHLARNDIGLEVIHLLTNEQPCMVDEEEDKDELEADLETWDSE